MMSQRNYDVNRVSIVTVVFNARQMLARTIEAIDALEYSNIEHVIIDGGSTDGTEELLKIERKISVRSVSEPDSGIYDAMNKGVRLSSGNFLWFLNAGDAPANSKVLNIFMNDDLPDVVYGDTHLVDVTGKKISVVKAPANLSASLMRWGMKVSHQSIIFRKCISSDYDLRYSYIADQKWIVDGLERSSGSLYIYGPMSKYLLGGLSDRHYNRFWLEKVAYSFREFGIALASIVTIRDIFMAARFHVSRRIRNIKMVQIL